MYWQCIESHPPTQRGVQPGLSAELRSAARVDIITSLSTAVCQRVLYSFWMALSADWLPPVALMPQARQCHLSWQIPSKFNSFSCVSFKLVIQIHNRHTQCCRVLRGFGFRRPKNNFCLTLIRCLTLYY